MRRNIIRMRYMWIRMKKNKWRTKTISPCCSTIVFIRHVSTFFFHQLRRSANQNWTRARFPLCIIWYYYMMYLLWSVRYGYRFTTCKRTHTQETYCIVCEPSLCTITLCDPVHHKRHDVIFSVVHISIANAVSSTYFSKPI